jgi:hypothetical protein
MLDAETDAGESAFLAARSGTDRGAWMRWLRSEVADRTDDAAVAAAAACWKNISPLQDPALASFSLCSLASARGRRVDGRSSFPATFWFDGATGTGTGGSRPGTHFLGTIAEFVEVLVERSTHLAPKREGWVVEPTTNVDGRRTNDSTVEMHALFLDCDGTGTWDRLLGALADLDFAHVAYQSGGWSPEVPKWRVVLPLHAPHDVASEDRRQTWKAIYNHARVALGSVGDLGSVGFDPATETPCCPWFLTERRAEGDPPRQVTWRPGHSLDLVALALALPSHDPARRATVCAAASSVEEVALGDARLEEIVSRLARATSRVAVGRRDIYLSLPGVLLDRGLSAEDVLTIVEEVSARYPRSHPEKHADNVHCAKTTIAKWEDGGRVTRIGTLNEVAPDVASVVDDVLPDAMEAEIVESMRRMLGAAAPQLSPQPSPPQSPSTMSAGVPAIPAAPPLPAQVPTDRKTLRKILVQMRRKKVNRARRAETAGDGEGQLKNGVEGLLLDHLLRGRDLTVSTGLDRAGAIRRAAGILAFKLPRMTPLADVAEFFRESVSAMLVEGESPEAMLRSAETSYLVSLKSRIERVDDRNAQMIAAHERGQDVR